MLRPVYVVFLLVSFTAPAGSISAGEDSDTFAEKVLAETVIQGGLVVHLGSGDGKLTAALGPTEACRVHRLDPSFENVVKLRGRFREQGLLGSITVQ